MSDGFIDYCFGALLITASVCIFIITIKMAFFGGCV
jgi:hypothetical protein